MTESLFNVISICSPFIIAVRCMSPKINHLPRHVEAARLVSRRVADAVILGKMSHVFDYHVKKKKIEEIRSFQYNRILRIF